MLLSKVNSQDEKKMNDSQKETTEVSKIYNEKRGPGEFNTHKTSQKQQNQERNSKDPAYV